MESVFFSVAGFRTFYGLNFGLLLSLAAAGFGFWVAFFLLGLI